MAQLEKNLLSQGWDSEKIYDTIIETNAEMMETFFMLEDDNITEKMNEIMEENLGFVCGIDELFALYDELVERAYPSKKYYDERSRASKQIANW
jgi:predicted S18 family serine protease